MTIATETAKSGPYEGDGANTSFAYNFKVFEKEALLVTFTSALGVESVLTVDVDYTVNNVGSDTGTITYPISGSPLAAGTYLTLTRTMEFTQEVDLENQGGYYPDVVETVFDRMEMKLQELKEEVDRSVKTDVSSSTTPDQLLDDIDASVAAAAASETAAAASAAAAAASWDDVLDGFAMNGTDITEQTGGIVVSTGNSGVTVASVDEDDLVVEGSGDTGISILSPNTQSCAVVFGDPDDNDVGNITYQHVTDKMNFAAGGSQLFRIDGSGSNIIVGSIGSDALGAGVGSLTVSTGDSGASTIAGGGDDFIIEGSGSTTGMSIMAPDANNGQIVFGGVTTSNRANLIFYGATAQLSIRNMETGGTIRLHQNVLSNNMLMNATGQFIFGDENSDALGAEQGSITISTGNSGVSAPAGNADDLVIENDANGGISLLSPNTNSMNIAWGDPDNSAAGKINYSHTTNVMTFTTNGASGPRIESDGSISVTNVTTYEALVTDDDDIPNKKYVDDKFSFLIIAEESSPIDTIGGSGADGFQWSHGNGVGNAYGIAVPVACEITDLTFAEGTNTAITATVQVYKNGAAVTGATISLAAAASGTQNLATAVSLAAGDRVAFKTTAGTAQGTNGTVTALCRAT